MLLEKNVLNPRRQITPEDLVAPPGKALKLKVWVRRDVFPLVDPPRRGVEVRLKRGDKSWSAKTSAAGLAEFDVEALEEGLHTFTVECEGTADELLVAVTTKPVIIVDIDKTIARCSQFTFLFKETRHVKVMKGSPEMLALLAHRFQIAFLTARDRILRERTREWLAMNGFPKAPLLVRRRRYWQQKAREHKIERLAELAPVALAAGVGDTTSDIEAYQSRGMKAIRFGRDVKSWEEVAAQLMRP